MAEEESSAPAKVKPAPKAGSAKKAAKPQPKPAGPGAIAAGGLADSAKDDSDEGKGKGEEPKVVESFSATGIDNMIDLLEVVNAKTDKASVGSQAAGIERHPEVNSLLVIFLDQPSNPIVDLNSVDLRYVYVSLLVFSNNMSYFALGRL